MWVVVVVVVAQPPPSHRAGTSLVALLWSFWRERHAWLVGEDLVDGRVIG